MSDNEKEKLQLYRSIKFLGDTIESQYDPENDVASPRVSATDVRLQAMIEHLLDYVKLLEEEIQSLKDVLSK